jgi:hypothetical protein
VELGLVGVIVGVLLFAVLIGGESTVNMAIVAGMLPTKGDIHP